MDTRATELPVAQSVDTLLAVVAQPQAITPATIVAQLEEMVLASSAGNDPTSSLVGH